MNPILKYLLNLSAFQRVVGQDPKISGLAKADALLSDLVKEKKVPGLALTVLKAGEIVLQKGYGYADMQYNRPIHPKKTIFRIASVSKNIASAALAHMVDDGQIDLDASFYDYVPYYPKKQWDFTIRQLAGHTAGIRGYKGTEYALNEPYTIKESIKIFKDDDLLFEPGTDYFYNSYDWVLISLAMQEISGIPFEEYVQHKVLQPLAMMHTLHNESRVDQIEDRATFYTKRRLGFRKAIAVDNFYKLAGGGYLSTSDDIAKFGQACLEGKIIGNNIRSQFLTSQRVNDALTYYGLGWQVSKDKHGRNYYGHIGNGVGGYSNFLVYPNERMVIAILINCTGPKVQEELDKIVDVLLSMPFDTIL